MSTRWMMSAASAGQDQRAPQDLEAFDAMFREHTNRGRSDPDDERGTLNLVTATRSRDAAGPVRSGVTVPLVRNPIPDEPPDKRDVEALAETAARENRWEFLLTAAPNPVEGGTGSPLNPIAVFRRGPGECDGRGPPVTRVGVGAGPDRSPTRGGSDGT